MKASEPSSPNKKPKIVARYLAALFYDSLLLCGILFIASVIYLVPFIMSADSEQSTNISANAVSSPLYKSYLFFIWFAFFAWFWTKAGQTLGLAAWKLRVESLDGKYITIWQALLRFLAAIFPWFVALFLYHLLGKFDSLNPQLKYWVILLGFSGILWSLFDKRSLTLQDRFSESHIVCLKTPTSSARNKEEQ